MDSIIFCYLLTLWFAFDTGKCYSWVSSCKTFCISQDEWHRVPSIWDAKPLLAKFAFWRTNEGVYLTLDPLPLPRFFCTLCWFWFWYRQWLLRFKIFLSLAKRRRLYSVHKKDNCGDLHLFLLHNLANRSDVSFLGCLILCWYFMPWPDSPFEVLQLFSHMAFVGGWIWWIFGLQFYVDTVKQMALRQLIAGSPLRTLCLLIAGQPAEVFSTDTSISEHPGASNMAQQSSQVILIG